MAMNLSALIFRRFNCADTFFHLAVLSNKLMTNTLSKNVLTLLILFDNKI